MQNGVHVTNDGGALIPNIFIGNPDRIMEELLQPLNERDLEHDRTWHSETGFQERGIIKPKNKCRLSFLLQTCLYNHYENKSSQCDKLSAIVVCAKGFRNMEKDVSVSLGRLEKTS